MDDIIQKLIEFDRQCVEKVELAKKKKAEAQSSMMSQKSTIYSEYIDSQQDQVEKHKQDLLNKNKEAFIKDENNIKRIEDKLKIERKEAKKIMEQHIKYYLSCSILFLYSLGVILYLSLNTRLTRAMACIKL